jgi:hypothetical protein
MGSPLADIPAALGREGARQLPDPRGSRRAPEGDTTGGGGVLGSGWRAQPASGEARARVALPLAIGAGPGMLHPSDGVGEWLDVLQRPVSAVFPANKIFTHCGKCGIGIERFKGYKHYPVGDRKTYCWKCHLAKGLPLRDDDLGAAE